MDALLELPDLPANAELLAWLREQAGQPSGPDDYVLGGWQLHTHPDLMSYLRSDEAGWFPNEEWRAIWATAKGGIILELVAAALEYAGPLGAS